MAEGRAATVMTTKPKEIKMQEPVFEFTQTEVNTIHSVLADANALLNTLAVAQKHVGAAMNILQQKQPRMDPPPKKIDPLMGDGKKTPAKNSAKKK